MDLRAELSEHTSLAPADLDKMCAALQDDWRQANLLPLDAALCAYGVRLTKQPSKMTEAEVLELRRLGLSDEGILNAVQVVAFFNYINRVADSIHVDLEPEMTPYPEPNA